MEPSSVTERIGGEFSLHARSYLCKVRETRGLGEAVRATIALGLQTLVLAKVAIICRGSSRVRFFQSGTDFMDNAIALGARSGDWCEFGVFQGKSLRYIASRTTETVHGFDSFQGLSESWAGLKKGTFSTAGKLPEAPSNVVFHVGYFDESVPQYLRSAGPIAFVHIDSDLYASAVTVLRGIRSHLRPGSIMVFDELVGAFHNDELSALRDELVVKGVQIEWIGFYLSPGWGVSASLRVVSGTGISD